MSVWRISVLQQVEVSMAAQRVQAEDCLAFIRDAIMRACPASGNYPVSSVPGLRFHCQTSGGGMRPLFYEPLAILVAQGAKAVEIGGEKLRYGPGVCFLCGIDMPVSSCVVEASPEEPFLALSLSMDVSLAAELAAKMPPFPHDGMHFSGAATQAAEPNLLDAFARLVELVEHPAPALDGLVLREIYYRLLSSPFGSVLRSLTTLGSHGNRVSRAIAWLKENYTKPFAVESLAEVVHMAPSTFHKYFKEITSVSPLQFQKRLRLDEARRLMVAEGYDVTRAALAVGYESSTQFIREYKRLFGDPPKRSISGIKNTVKVADQ